MQLLHEIQETGGKQPGRDAKRQLIEILLFLQFRHGGGEIRAFEIRRSRLNREFDVAQPTGQCLERFEARGLFADRPEKFILGLLNITEVLGRRHRLSRGVERWISQIVA